jgi:hypothetical protein
LMPSGEDVGRSDGGGAMSAAVGYGSRVCMWFYRRLRGEVWSTGM